MMHCTCAREGKWERQEGWRLDFNNNIWVHSKCGKPSKANYNKKTELDLEDNWTIEDIELEELAWKLLTSYYENST